MNEKPLLIAPKSPIAWRSGGPDRAFILARADEASTLTTSLNAANFRCSLEEWEYEVGAADAAFQIIRLARGTDITQLRLWLSKSP